MSRDRTLSALVCLTVRVCTFIRFILVTRRRSVYYRNMFQKYIMYFEKEAHMPYISHVYNTLVLTKATYGLLVYINA